MMTPPAPLPIPGPEVSRGGLRFPVVIRSLGLAEYVPTWNAMKAFTAGRDAGTADEIWLLQHPPVFTLGQAGKPEHLLDPGEIPVIKIDRGGQVTYHGPGQVVLYLLLDLRRHHLTVKRLVRNMEQSVIDLLGDHGITAERRSGAPGVYVRGAKIAALGLKVSAGCCYHGLAFNVDMDLSPFLRINPCGFPGLAVTQARDLGIRDSAETLGGKLAQKLISEIAARS